MNNRIKELGLQAADWLENQDSINTAHAMQLYQEKFAELIVRECAELNFRELGLSGSASFDVGRMIKQHFGVEE